MINKSDILAKLNPRKFSNTSLDKNDIISKITDKVDQKALKKSDFLNALPRNPELANKSKEIKFESRTGMERLNIKSITNRIILEAAADVKNPIRLDLKSLAVSNIHSKFTVNRGQQSVVVEMLYPNANNEVTVKIIMKGGEDKLFTIDPEDPKYQNNFGALILKEIDKTIVTNANKPQFTISNTDVSLTGSGNPSPVLPALGGYAPVWESAWLNAMALVEADDEDEKNADAEDTENAIDSAADAASKGVNSEDSNSFGAEDFSADAGSDDMFTGDFGGSGSLSSLGGGMVSGDSAGGAGGVNSDGNDVNGELAGEFIKFRTKDDWTQSSLDTMQKLTANATAEQMRNGNGVVLSSNDVLKGTVGIENDSNYQIVDKFLKIYSELDEVDIPVEMMNEIEDKLSKDDGQFDAFLQQNLSKITGSDEIDSTLNNEMFNDFSPIEPMGGEKSKVNNPEQPKTDESDDKPETDLDAFFDLDIPDAEDVEKDANDDEFPNLS